MDWYTQAATDTQNSSKAGNQNGHQNGKHNGKAKGKAGKGGKAKGGDGSGGASTVSSGVKLEDVSTDSVPCSNRPTQPFTLLDAYSLYASFLRRCSSCPDGYGSSSCARRKVMSHAS